MVLKQRQQGIKIIAALVTACASAIVFVLCIYACAGMGVVSPVNLWTYPLYAGLAFAGILMEGLRSPPVLVPNRMSLRKWVLSLALRQHGAVLVLIFASAYLSHDYTISRKFLAIYSAVNLLLLAVCNAELPPALHRVCFRGSRRQKALIFAPSHQGKDLSNLVDQHRDMGLDLVGFVQTDEGPQPGSPEHPLVVLETKLNQHRPQVVIAAIMDPILCGSRNGIARIQSLCERRASRLVFALQLPREIAGVAEPFTLGNQPWIGLGKEPLESPWNRALKRLFDVLISLPVVLFLLPPLAFLVWVLQRWQAPGSLLFRQTRSGQGGESFTIFKFRTMFEGNPDEAKQARQGDSRIYPAGKFLRRTCLDELPQFINVLMGDMSVVGPRPHMPEHDEWFLQQAERYPVRTYVKPGITGLAQVRGYRGEVREPEDVLRRTEADIEYIRGWSLMMDCRITAETVRQMVQAPATAC